MKSVFQVHGVDTAGEVVVRRQLKRRYILAFFHKLPACLVGIEACASAHYFALLAILLIVFSKAGAHAQTPDVSPQRSTWNHNGSVMYLVAHGSTREFYYEKPRPGMLEAGAKPGSLLFRGEVNNGQYSGTAYIFNPRCGQIPFQVKGAILDSGERVVLTGQAPRAERKRQTYATYTSTLEFRLSKSIADSLSPEAQKEDEDKPEVRLTGGNTLGTASAQPAAANDDPSQARKVSGNITRPPLGAPLPQQDKKTGSLGTIWTITCLWE